MAYCERVLHRLAVFSRLLLLGERRRGRALAAVCMSTRRAFAGDAECRFVHAARRYFGCNRDSLQLRLFVLILS